MKYTSALIHADDIEMSMTFYPEGWYYGSKTETMVLLDQDLWSWLTGKLRWQDGFRISMGPIPSMWYIRIV